MANKTLLNKTSTFASKIYLSAETWTFRACTKLPCEPIDLILNRNTHTLLTVKSV